ncbi:recQ-mediated genome instability protein 1 [Ornithorhynchus anatinus]|uniref:RecQ-mediated genome instability protein 1 n=1 Tax=Ornithorhynchus anatinus TaxID=9258 RepID=F6ZMF2_ORNAN|nr:recQ-mediated genome instability protein 1 [Ornithorhynchus anatinus]XP_028911532.1 recQ-mediated genome instability protein 1 [Ornithorhynchus anatinus]XP_028911533.1 recQ-mediated genome instability protein 1 [Ornithorhynchus anatinus]XP_028911534.1 recQ-mediated genome instability protein 1 [Ornithorhynchus anatinus]
MNVSGIAQRVETWLSATWHVKVPGAWLDACINWIQGENGINLTQAQMNKQVFDQWLFTDLRDLEFPLLPNDILNFPKGELNGFYSLQLNTVIDISQPAYSQLQKLRGKNTTNEQVTAETQAPPKPWEVKPERVLMLQITDGVVQIQGMEYQPIPALHSSLIPGTKLLLHGRIEYRLGILLLKPENVKVLGGEVDILLKEYAQERVLARLIGEPEPPDPVSSDNKPDNSEPMVRSEQVLEPSDEELLASLENSDGFVAMSTSDASNPVRPLLIDERSKQGFAVSLSRVETLIPSSNFSDGNSDDFSLEEALLLQEAVEKERLQVEGEQPVAGNRSVDKPEWRVSPQPSISHDSSIYTAKESGWNERIVPDLVQAKSFEYPSAREKIGSSVLAIKSDMQQPQDSIIKTQGVEKCKETDKVIGNPTEYILNDEEPDTEPVNLVPGKSSQINVHHDHHKLVYSLQSSESNTSPAVDLDSPPFTYIFLLLAKKPDQITTIKVKAFIVTLTGNLKCCEGFWSLTAKISDGTAYLDVYFADEILTSLIGFSVMEMKQFKKNPSLHQKLKKALEQCQRELIDLCCVMTITYNPSLDKAKVIALRDVNLKDLENLKKRLNK